MLPASEPLGSSREESSAQWHAMLLSGLFHACLCSDVHLICDKGWRTQHVPNRTCVIFNIIVFIAMVTPPKWIGFVLGAICLFIKYMPGWTTVKPQWPGWSSYWCLRCCSSWLTSWLPVLSGFSDPWYFTLAGALSVWGEGTFWDPSQAVHAWKACLAATEMSIRTCTSWHFIFAFGIEPSSFHLKKI